MRKIFAFVFKLLGWRVEGAPPPNTPKYIIVVAPHTSNWDFLVGVGARSVLNYFPRFVAKKELFFWPAGWFFRKLGGYPVARNVPSHFVDQMVSIFNEKDDFVLTIAPEGTRSYNDRWKRGFFFIAQKAEVPIVPIAFDYPSKTVIVGKSRMAMGGSEEFILSLKKWFSSYKGHRPELGIEFPGN